jgi:site-specific DNA-methyltransferase (adenine-specific)
MKSKLRRIPDLHKTYLKALDISESKENDIVLDAYCGCGTTVAVCQKLDRQWIGIDITYQSISLILKRLEDSFPGVLKTIKLHGIPKDIESAIALANKTDDRTRKEFEKWAILTYTNNKAVINTKKGADKGIDGIVYF